MECAQTLFVDDILQFFIAILIGKIPATLSVPPSYSIANPARIRFLFLLIIVFCCFSFFYFVLLFLLCVFISEPLCTLCPPVPRYFFAGLC